MSKFKKLKTCEIFSFMKEGMKSYGLGERTIYTQCRGIVHLTEFMDANNISVLTPAVFKLYYVYLAQDTHYKKGTIDCFRAAATMLESLVNGLPYSRLRGHEYIRREFPQTILGQLGKEFCESLYEQRLSEETIEGYRYSLIFFTRAMDLDDITISTLNRENIMHYVGTIEKNRRTICMCIRRFLTYLYENSLITYDYGEHLRGIKNVEHEKVISYYSPEEIAAIEGAVDRTTLIGKRDYAIILLASRLGLRSSDIAGLQFSNLDWDSNTIRIIQYKTKKLITLPILADVGDAIIDYVKNSRPEAELPFVFISRFRPFNRLKNVSELVHRYIMKSGVNTKGRHSCAHSLRHSLATTMLNNGTDLPTISEALGHRTVVSTLPYLHISVNTLLECSLSVPEVNDAFYMQRGGIFYERHL